MGVSIGWLGGYRLSRVWVWLLCCVFWCLPAHAANDDEPLEITELQVDRADDGYHLSAQLAIDLPQSVENALNKGIPLFFVAEAQLSRERWYWTDRPISTVTRYLRLAYQPLTRRWRLNQSSEPWSNSSATSLSQHFDTLAEALQALRHLGRWKMAEPGSLEADGKYYVNLHVWLDVSQLPRPFQMGVVGQSDWLLDASRRLRLRLDAAK